MPSSVMKLSFLHFLHTLLVQPVLSLQDLPLKTYREKSYKIKFKQKVVLWVFMLIPILILEGAVSMEANQFLWLIKCV